jgi:hypothetical protein
MVRVETEFDVKIRLIKIKKTHHLIKKTHHSLSLWLIIIYK